MKRVRYIFALLAVSSISLHGALCDFMKAARANDTEMLQTLVDEGQDVNQQGKCGNTALIWAVIYQNADAISFLMNNGADASLKNSQALIEAAYDGNYDLVQTLITTGGALGGDQNSKALFAAIDNADLDMFEYLVGNGADISALDANNTSLLLYAVCKKADSIVAYLISEGADLDVCNKFGQFPLLAAIANRDLAMVQDLIAAGATVSLNDGIALERAISVGDVAIIQELVAAGLSVDSSSPAFISALAAKNTAVVSAALGDGVHQEV